MAAWDDCTCGKITADPDIAGIGVLASFIASSALSVISTGLYLAHIRTDPVDHQPPPPPPGTPSTKSSQEWGFDLLDRFVRRRLLDRAMTFLRQPTCIQNRLKRIERALFGLVQALADAQLVTGIAMLTAAVIKLHRDSITVYHFIAVTNLAWFGSGAHLLALLAIRTEVLGSMKDGFRTRYEEYGNAHSWGRWFRKRVSRKLDVWVRLLAMMLMAGLLLYCCWVAGADGLYDHYECPASCARMGPRGGKPLQWMIVSFVFVIRGYSEWVFLLWCTFQTKWIGSKWRERIVDKQGTGNDNWGSLPPWKRFWVWVWYVQNSETLTFVLDGLVWLAYGVASAFIDRNEAHEYFTKEDLWASGEERDKENDVEGFGQLVPLLLIGLPFLQVLQTYCAESRVLQLKPARAPGLNCADVGCHWVAPPAPGASQASPAIPAVHLRQLLGGDQ